MRLSRVFNHDELVTAGDLNNWIHLCHKPVQMDRQNRFRPGRDYRLDYIWIHRPAVGIHVDKNRRRAAIKNCRRRRHKCHGDCDHLIPGANSSRKQRQVKRRGPAVECNTIPNTAICRKAFLESGHFRAEHKLRAIDHSRYGNVDFRLYFLALGLQVEERYHGPFPCDDYSPIGRAGTPATIAFGATSPVTTAPAPIVAPSPMVTPHKIVAFDPMDARRQTRVDSTFQSAGPCGLPSSVVALGNLSLMNITPCPTKTSSSIITPSQIKA